MLRIMKFNVTFFLISKNSFKQTSLVGNKTSNRTKLAECKFALSIAL